MEKFTVNLKALTPIWTGDVAQECSEIKPQGIRGSLRWWYEAIVRFMGGWACDPTSKNNCVAELKEGEKKPKNICDVCMLFGCTGWASRFRLDVACEKKAPKLEDVSLGQGYDYGKLDGYEGITNLNFTIPYKIEPEMITGLDFAIRVAVLYGSLGAKGQHGMGYVKSLKDSFKELPAPTEEEIRAWKRSLSKKGKGPGLPDLSQFFFAEIQAPEKYTVKPVSARFATDEVKLVAKRSAQLEWMVREIKRPLRELFRGDYRCSHCKVARHEIAGNAAGKRIASKINISRVYPQDGENRIRVYGWIPDDIKFCRRHGPSDRREALQMIRDRLGNTKHCKILYWKEWTKDLDRCQWLCDLAKGGQ